MSDDRSGRGWRDVLRFRTGLAAGVIALAILAAMVVVSKTGSGDAQEQDRDRPVVVEVVVARRDDVPHVVEAVGTVRSLQQITVRAQVEGILTSVDFVEGGHVSQGQVIARIDHRAARAALLAAEAQLQRDIAQLRAAELDLDRYRNLVARDAIARQSVDQQTAQVEQLRAIVRLDQANVATTKVNLSFTQIHSPVTGRVGIRRIDAGNLVRPSDPDGIVSVAQINPISVVFPVPQATFAELGDTLRARGNAVVEVRDRNGGQRLATGSITALDNAIDVRSGTADVRARMANPRERLTPGEFVAVRIETGRSPGAIVVPTATVRPGLDGPFVYRVEDGVARRVPVRLGYGDDEWTVIAAGIKAGEAIVSDGYAQLRDGAKVKIAK
jgi:membrane fusion protein, multidrug efflux system